MSTLRQNALVLIVDQSGVLGGAELSLLEICKQIPTSCNVILFASGPFKERLEELGISVGVVGSESLGAVKKSGGGGGIKTIFEVMRMIFNVANLAKSHKIIYANTQKAMVISVVAGIISRRPVVWHLRDIVSAEHFSKSKLTIIKLASRYLKHVIANSKASAEALQNLSHMSSDRLSVVYNGIDSESFDAANKISIETHRSRYGLPEKAYLVGSFSRLALWKGQHVLLDSIAGRPEVHAVLVGAALFGEEDYENSLKERARILGIQDRVHFLGFQRDIASLMCAVDVVVHTSTVPEPFGRVIVEAMLARRPIIASAAGGVVEIIENQAQGVLFPPGDSICLGDAIDNVRNDARATKDRVERAYLHACANFSPRVYSNAVMHRLSVEGGMLFP